LELASGFRSAGLLAEALAVALAVAAAVALDFSRIPIEGIRLHRIQSASLDTHQGILQDHHKRLVGRYKSGSCIDPCHFRPV
jgi:hypothetical protein